MAARPCLGQFPIALKQAREDGQPFLRPTQRTPTGPQPVRPPDWRRPPLTKRSPRRVR